MPTPSRLSAANALYSVFAKAQRVGDDWDSGLSHEDAGLAQAILGLCLRRWGRLNSWCLPKLKDPARSLPTETRIALGMGLAQLAWLPGVADHAAVAESVELISHGSIGFSPHKGLVNAILRSASRDRTLLAAELDSLPAELDQTGYAKRLLQAALLSRDTPENLKTLWNKLQQPPLPAFAALGGTPPDGLTPHGQFPQAWRLLPGAPFPFEWLRSGAGMVQDISSQALMDFNWPSEKPDPARILDLCAAPGGKTTALAHRWPQAKIFAVEQNPRRAQRLRENLAARGLSATVEQAEAAAWLRRGGRPFDLILIDAPCTASGTLRKHPELNWIRSGADIERLARVQETLIDAALSRLSPGGLLIYSVCSWFPEEGFNHLPRLESINPQITPAPIWPAGQGTGQGTDKGTEGLTHLFRPDPLTWDGEGFQGFAVISKV